MNIGFIGLGKMGYAIAKNLLATGNRISIYNRSSGPVRELASAGALACPNAAAAAAGADVLFSMLSDDAVTEKMIFGDKEPGAITTLPKGSLHVALSTLSPTFADRLMQAHAEQGQGYLSAPVFGRPSAAAEKKLYIVLGGRTEWIARVRPLLESISQGIFVVGGKPSTANTIKVAGNFLIASALQSMAEAFALTRKAGIAPEQFLEVLNTALFKSPVYSSYGRMIAEGKYDGAGFGVKLGLKDVRLATAAADRLEVPMPIASVLHDQLLTALSRGNGEKDWAFLGALAAENAGLKD